MPIELGNELGNNVWGRGYIYYNYDFTIDGRPHCRSHAFAAESSVGPAHAHGGGISARYHPATTNVSMRRGNSKRLPQAQE